MYGHHIFMYVCMYVFSYPRSRRRIWSSARGSAVPSRVSPPVLHAQTDSGAYSHENPPAFRGGVYLCNTVNRHRVSSEFIRSRNCVSMAFVAESLQDSSSNECCLFRDYHGLVFVRLSFPTATTGAMDMCDIEIFRGALLSLVITSTAMVPLIRLFSFLCHQWCAGKKYKPASEARATG